MCTIKSILALVLPCCLADVTHASSPAPLSSGRYRVLCGEQKKDPPFEAVRITYGPGPEQRGAVRWQLEVLAKDADDSPILFQLRVETLRDPLADDDEPLEFMRYVLRVPGAGPPLDYRDVHTGQALLPGWGQFRSQFMPQVVRNARRVDGLPATLKYMGHVLTLREVNRDAPWSEWSDVKTLILDPELIIGTGRIFKDAEGRRLPQSPERQNYTYVDWNWQDYRTMIDAGMTIFGVAPGCRERLLAEPVFHRGGVEELSFPADLYRSNYVGPIMYLDELNELAHATTGQERQYTAEEMFRYYFAFLRGAARHFNGNWGISIYGQADPSLTPLAVRLAYDMGAGYVWYWTSDHDHHLPWSEQLELTRLLNDHAREHPRDSTFAPQLTLDKAIVIPYGYFLALESPTGRKNPWDLWWVREMDAAGENESSQRYRSLMQRALLEVQRCLDADEQFDIIVDDGREIQGYRKVVRLQVD